MAPTMCMKPRSLSSSLSGRVATRRKTFVRDRGESMCPDSSTLQALDFLVQFSGFNFHRRNFSVQRLNMV